MKTQIGLFILAIVLGSSQIVNGGILLPLEAGDEFAREIETVETRMLEHFSCPHMDANWIWCKIWRNNHLSTLLD